MIHTGGLVSCNSNQVPNNKPVLVCVGDLHLSHKPPISRSSEDDWYRVMERQLNGLRQLVISPTGEQKIPVVCAGDVFDSWRVPAETINLALSYLPQCYGIYGNHDLPNHDIKSLPRSPYWTLVKAGKIIPLESNNPVEIPNGKQPIRLYGFPFGTKVKPLKEPHDLYLEVAVVHDFLWINGKGYDGASQENRLKYVWKKLRGYDVVFYGDNHQSFDVKGKTGLPNISNCGGFFRRKIDEKSHKPSIIMLYADGSTKRHYLDCSKDKFLDQVEESKVIGGVDFERLREEISSLVDVSVNFKETIENLLRSERIPKEVKRFVLESLQDD